REHLAGDGRTRQLHAPPGSEGETLMSAPKPKRARSATGHVNCTNQLANNLDYCRERLLEEGGLPPMFVIHTKARLVIYPCSFVTDWDKDNAFNVAKLLCIAENAIGLSFMGE